MIFVEDSIIKRIEKLFYNFIWTNNVHKVKKSTIIALIEDGGLGMIDLKSCYQAAKGSWVRRLLNNDNSKWKELTWAMLDINAKRLININNLESNVKGKSLFHARTAKCLGRNKQF